MATDTFDTTTISASSATFSLHSEAEIDAPASLVFNIYIDTATWPSWNSLNPQVNIIKHALDDQNHQDGPHITIGNAQLVAGSADGPQLQAMPTVLREGTIMNVANITQKSGLSSFSMFLCFDVDADARTVSWVYDSDMNPYPKAVLEIERTTEVLDLGDGRCRFRTLERQKGVKASYAKLRYGKALQKGFDAQAQGLKQYAEAKYKNSQ